MGFFDFLTGKSKSAPAPAGATCDNLHPPTTDDYSLAPQGPQTVFDGTWRVDAKADVKGQTKQILDNWGLDGWELVQVVPGPNSENLIAYMKRPLG